MKITPVSEWHDANPKITPYVNKSCTAIRKRGFVIEHEDSRMFVDTKAKAEAITVEDFAEIVPEPWEYYRGLSNLEAMQN